MSVEACFAVNLVADAMLLGAASRALGIFDPRRLACASLLCALYGVWGAAHPGAFSGVAFQLLLLCAVAGILTGFGPARLWRTSGLTLLLAGLAGGGGRVLCPVSGPMAAPACACVGAAALTTLLSARPPRSSTWHVTVGLRVGKKAVTFPALIDTGNRLREPVTRQPVLIAEAALLGDVLPQTGYRILCYGAVGCNGRMACFKPGALWIERNGVRRAVKNAWIGVSPDRLPGLERALAPSEFTYYI